MPGRGTPKITVRLPEDVWRRFGELAGDERRAAVIREFVLWYIRQPGANLPKRP